MRLSPHIIDALLEASHGYGKLYAKHPAKREEVRARWEEFCETFASDAGFEIQDMMRMRFNQGCFANYWS